MLGKPVIITGYPTAESQLRNGIDGIIVPLENRACGEKISEILREPKRLEKLVQECRKKDYSNRQEINKIECNLQRIEMRIRIITCYDVYNAGASLQAYALMQYFERLRS